MTPGFWLHSEDPVGRVFRKRGREEGVKILAERMGKAALGGKMLVGWGEQESGGARGVCNVS